MATNTLTALAGNLSSDATFQALVTSIDSAIVAVGWVVTSDTGQITPASVIRAGAGLFAGYRLYRMNDSLQATAPCFLKVYYGQASSASVFKMSFQTGTGTDGAGNLTGNQSGVYSNAATTIVTATSYVSGTSSRLQMALWPSAPSQSFYLSIDRDRDAAGAETAHGVHIVFPHPAAVFQQYIPATTVGVASSAETKLCSLLSSQASQANGTTIGVGVIRPVYGSLRNPIIGMLTCSRADFTTEVTNSITLYGTARTYLALTTLSSIIATAVANNSQTGALLLYE